MFAIARACFFQFGLRNRAMNVADLTRMLAGLILRRNDLLFRLFVGELRFSSMLVSRMKQLIWNVLLLKLLAHVQRADNYNKISAHTMTYDS